jgi:hypothetical protein
VGYWVSRKWRFWPICLLGFEESPKIVFPYQASSKGKAGSGVKLHNRGLQRNLRRWVRARTVRVHPPDGRVPSGLHGPGGMQVARGSAPLRWDQDWPHGHSSRAHRRVLKIVYRHGYQQAVREGFMVDYRAVAVQSVITMNGAFLHQKIKASQTVYRPVQRIREFRNRQNPGIVVTGDMLSTSVDVPRIENIVFLMCVKFGILFEQMMGRGARRCKEIQKTHFTVFDCFIIEKYPDGYVAYPVGVSGVVVGEGDSYEEALPDVQSDLKFHLETFGADALGGEEGPVLEPFLVEAAV